MNGPSTTPYVPRPVAPDDPPPVFGPGAPPAAAVRPPKEGPQKFVVYHDNAIPLWSQWDVPTALSALDQHALGQFYQSSLLSDAMGMDDAFDAVVQTRILGLISRPRELRQSSRGDQRKARLALRVIRERWDEIFPEDVLASLMHAYLLMGFAPAQQLWRYDDKLWIPTLQSWHTSTIYFDVPTRHYVANTMEGPVYIRPGDGRWVLLTPFGSYRGWMRGAVRAVVIPYLARQYALRDWARYNEVHGLPIKLAKAPAKAQGDDKVNFQNAIANLGNETTVLLPQGIGDKDGVASYGLELLEAKADTYEAFKDIVSKCEERMAIRLLGQNLTTQIDAGSFAAANVHDRVRLDYTRFDAKALAALRDQVLRAFCMFNFGDPDVAPEVLWKVTPPEDSLQRADALSKMADALVKFGQVTAPVDMRRLLERADVPLVAESADELRTPQPPAPPPAAAPAADPAKSDPPKDKPAPDTKTDDEKQEAARRHAELRADIGQVKQHVEAIDRRVDTTTNALAHRLDEVVQATHAVDKRVGFVDQKTDAVARKVDDVNDVVAGVADNIEKVEEKATALEQTAEAQDRKLAAVRDGLDRAKTAAADAEARLAKKIESERPKQAEALPFAKRNAAFLADMSEMRAGGFEIDQRRVDELAKLHDVPAPKLRR